MKRYLFPVLALAALASCTKDPEYSSAEDLAPIAINEVCPGWSSENAWIELVNTSSSPVDIYGLQILVSDDYYYRYKVYQAPKREISVSERFVVSIDKLEIKPNTLEEVVLASADGSVLCALDVKNLDRPEENGSWSRIPDTYGDFTATETATNNSKNYKFVPYQIEGMVFNEICQAGSWVELVYDAINGSLTLDESRIVSTDKNGSEKTLFTFAEGTTAEAGEKIVVDVQFGDFSSISLVSNENKTVASFALSDLKDDLGAQTESYARFPDLKGDWYCCYHSTKAQKNEDSSTDDSVLVINELNLAEGWVEVYNPTVRQVKSESAKIACDGKTVSASGEYAPGAVKSFILSSGSDSSVSLYDSKQNVADRFDSSLVKDGSVPSVGSWSRIPDGSSWYTVKTSSKNESNYGITKYNTVGIWYRQSSTPSLERNMLTYARKGVGHIFLHEYAFRYYEELIPSILAKAEEYGIKIHIWMQCFWWNDKEGVNGWRSPVDDKNKCYDQALFDDILGAERAEKYVKAGVQGIHFDYIRFGGTAYKHDFPEYGISGVGAINEFLRQADEKLRGINPDLIMSAALMGETGSERYYGQRPEDMAEYLDILIPMLYRYGKWNRPTMAGMGNWFANHGAPAQCWGGIQTYDQNSYGLTSDEIRLDAEAFVGSAVKGVCLFREGLGEVPDLRHLKLNE